MKKRFTIEVYAEKELPNEQELKDALASKISDIVVDGLYWRSNPVDIETEVKVVS